MNRDILEKIFFLGFMMILIVLFFFPSSVGKGLIYSGDFTGSDGFDLNLPLKANLGQSLKELKFPFWTERLFCGYPLLPEGQTGMFYPPNIVFSLFSPLWCFNGLIFFHIALAGLGIFTYCRFKNLSFHASVLASIAFTFSSCYLLKFRHLNSFSAACWFPLLLYFSEKQIKTRKPEDILPWCAVLSLQWLAGHPAMTYLGLFGVFLLYFYAFICDLRSGKERNRFYFYFLSFLAGALFSGCLSLIQLLPTAELIPVSRRSVMSLSEVVKFPYTPLSLFHFINPFFLGNPARATYPLTTINIRGVFWENCYYMGIIPLFLAVLSLIYWKHDSRIRYYFWFIIVGIGLALGPSTILFRFLWEVVPGFHFFRFPSRFLIFSAIGLALLYGIGWEKITEKIRDKTVKKLLFFSTIILSMANLYWFNWQCNSWVPASWLDSPGLFKFLPENKKDFRIYSFAANYVWQQAYLGDGGWMGAKKRLFNYRNLIAADYNLLYGVSQIGEKTWREGGMAPIRRAEFQDFLEKAIEADVRGNLAIVPDEAVSVLRMLSTRFIFSQHILANPLLKRISTDNGLEGSQVYEVKNPLPRVYIVHKYRLIKDPYSIIRTIFSSEFKPEEEVILEEVPSLEPGDGGGSGIEKSSFTNNRIEIDVFMENRGILFLSDTFFPGWKARIDGKEERIMRANYAFRALVVPEGSHRVIFSYEPISFKIGAAVSLISWFVFSVVVVLLFRKSKTIVELGACKRNL